jgi:hypothetical protein
MESGNSCWPLVLHELRYLRYRADLLNFPLGWSQSDTSSGTSWASTTVRVSEYKA